MFIALCECLLVFCISAYDTVCTFLIFYGKVLATHVHLPRLFTFCLPTIRDCKNTIIHKITFSHVASILKLSWEWPESQISSWSNKTHLHWSILS